MNKIWYINKNDQNFGPYSQDELLFALNAGELALDTMIWRKGLPQWQLLGTIVESKKNNFTFTMLKYFFIFMLPPMAGLGVFSLIFITPDRLHKFNESRNSSVLVNYDRGGFDVNEAAELVTKLLISDRCQDALFKNDINFMSPQNAFDERITAIGCLHAELCKRQLKENGIRSHCLWMIENSMQLEQLSSK